MIGKELTIFTIERGYAIIFHSTPLINHYTELEINATTAMIFGSHIRKNFKIDSVEKSELLQLGRCTEAVVLQIQHTEQQNMSRTGMFQQR